MPVHYRPLAPYRSQAPSAPTNGLAAPAGRVRDPAADRRCYDADLADLVAGAEPDLVVLAGWMHLLPSSFLDRFPDRVINLHPALPGQFPGSDAIGEAWQAFTAGRISHTGVMVHYVPDEGIDDGPPIASVEVPIGPGDTLGALRRRIREAEHELIVWAIAQALATQPRLGISARP